VHKLTLQHNNLHFARWRMVQVPLDSLGFLLTPTESSLDSLERQVIMAQRVAAWILRTKAQSFQLGDITRATIKDWAGLKPQDQSMVLDLLEHLGWCRLAQPDLGPALRGVSFQRGVQWIVNEKAHEVYALRAAYEKRVAEENYRLLQERVAPQRAEARTASE